jgi:hypothetical protein
MNDNPEMSDDTLISKYIEIRDAKAALKRKHEDELKPYDQNLSIIANAMLERLNERGTNATKSESGTAYKSIKTSATVQDRDVFLNYVVDNCAFALLTNHVSREEVEAVIDLTGAPPPGIDVSRTVVVNFRRS